MRPLSSIARRSSNSLRATAFPNAYFEKDNDVVDRSKGDYVFRESDDGGVEFVSIMFEMKNEADATKTKKKNEDFLKELDKDKEGQGLRVRSAGVPPRGRQRSSTTTG